MKKLFNARLVLYVIALLCLFAVPSHASAETSTLAEGKSGDLSWKIYERNETTTIEITGDGDYSFDEDGYPTWKDDMRNLGVTYAKVDVTGITTMKNMFEGCDELSEINFCYSDTSNVTDMSGMMQGCERISEFQGTVLDTSNVTNMSYMFSDCNFYCELNLSYFNTSKVEDMSGMFSQCETVSEESKIKIGRWDTSNVKDMSGMFSGCTAELELQSNDWDTSNVKDMSGMFSDGEAYNYVDVSKLETDKVEDMRMMFEGDRNIEELNLSNFNTSNVTDMSRMFADCYDLKKLDVSSFDTSKVQDISEMFYGCNSLVDLNLSNFDLGNLTLRYEDEEPYLCGENDSLLTIECPVNLKVNLRIESGEWWDKDGMINYDNCLPRNLKTSVTIYNFENAYWNTANNSSDVSNSTSSTNSNSNSKGNTTIKDSKTGVQNLSDTVLIKRTKFVTVKNKSGKKITLSWKKVAGSKGYQIQYSTNKKFKKKLTKTKTTKKTKMTIKKLKKKKIYYVRVRAYNVNGKKKVYGQWSKIKAIKIKR